MWDSKGPGVMDHVQTRRFLDPGFEGLDDGVPDPPLRPYVERLARGEVLADMEDVSPLTHWLSAFRCVLQLKMECFNASVSVCFFNRLLQWLLHN